MEQTYKVTIKEPDEIHAVVEETLEISRRNDVAVLMDHQEEPNVVRGRTEHLNLQGTEIPETRRHDGGETFYHDDTYCLMVGMPYEKSKNNEEVMEAWGKTAEDIVRDAGIEDPEYVKGDVYTTNRQVMGLSAAINEETVLLRGCFYTETPKIDSILREDGIEPTSFYNNIKTAQELKHHLEELKEWTEINAEDYAGRRAVSRSRDYQGELEHGRDPSSCVPALALDY